MRNNCFVFPDFFSRNVGNTVTPFKFAAIKVRGFEIMTYSRPFNFAVSYQNYFTVSYINVVFSYTNESMNPVYKKIKNNKIIFFCGHLISRI